MGDKTNDLVAQAVATLPPGSVWRQFPVRDHMASFVNVTRELEEQFHTFLVGSAAPTGVESEWRAARDAATERVAIMIYILERLAGSATMGPPDMFADEIGVWNWPSEGAPRLFLSRFFLAMFRIVYPTCRLMAFAYVGPVRASCGAWRPWDSDGQCPPEDVLAATDRFDDRYFEICSLGIRMCNILARESSAVRHRIGEDVVMQDVLCAFLASTPLVRKALFTDKDFSQWSMKQLDELELDILNPIQILFYIALEHPKPFRVRHKEKDEKQQVSPLAVVADFFMTIWEANRKLPFSTTGPASTAMFLREFVAMLLRLTKHTDNEGSRVVWNDWKRPYVENGHAPPFEDVCDTCDRPPRKADGKAGKLKRCSQCIVARYCSAECQQRAWKGAGKGDWLAHKVCCFPASDKAVAEWTATKQQGQKDGSGWSIYGYVDLAASAVFRHQ